MNIGYENRRNADSEVIWMSGRGILMWAVIVVFPFRCYLFFIHSTDSQKKPSKYVHIYGNRRTLAMSLAVN